MPCGDPGSARPFELSWPMQAGHLISRRFSFHGGDCAARRDAPRRAAARGRARHDADELAGGRPVLSSDVAAVTNTTITPITTATMIGTITAMVRNAYYNLLNEPHRQRLGKGGLLKRRWLPLICDPDEPDARCTPGLCLPDCLAVPDLCLPDFLTAPEWCFVDCLAAPALCLPDFLTAPDLCFVDCLAAPALCLPETFALPALLPGACGVDFLWFGIES